MQHYKRCKFNSKHWTGLSSTDLCTNEEMAIAIYDVYVELLLWTTARFYPPLALFHTSARFRKGYESYATLLSFRVSRIGVAQAPCAGFHHFRSNSSLFLSDKNGGRMSEKRRVMHASS